MPEIRGENRGKGGWESGSCGSSRGMESSPGKQPPSVLQENGTEEWGKGGGNDRKRRQKGNQLTTETKGGDNNNSRNQRSFIPGKKDGKKTQNDLASTPLQLTRLKKRPKTQRGDKYQGILPWGRQRRGKQIEIRIRKRSRGLNFDVIGRGEKKNGEGHSKRKPHQTTF